MSRHAQRREDVNVVSDRLLKFSYNSSMSNFLSMDELYNIFASTAIQTFPPRKLEG
ncbi:MAG: hypothetical protein F6K23_05245 [Okeania sp. SIO2C9]|uniref:hypothetical protein n=1 Tax=Okeania sp. SIO2C9 TaxID=2607791 RepID=UPI0013BFC821|nr:hypothetical protein [Okeania sp. SIO2C9]NEQ72528.1 hypothetical protein [Okeania sp. SIO2C9]